MVMVNMVMNVWIGKRLMTKAMIVITIVIIMQ